MPTTDPVALLVASYVMPAAMSACMLWSVYIVAMGGLAPWQVSRPLRIGARR